MFIVVEHGESFPTHKLGKGRFCTAGSLENKRIELGILTTTFNLGFLNLNKVHGPDLQNLALVFVPQLLGLVNEAFPKLYPPRLWVQGLPIAPGQRLLQLQQQARPVLLQNLPAVLEIKCAVVVTTNVIDKVRDEGCFSFVFDAVVEFAVFRALIQKMPFLHGISARLRLLHSHVRRASFPAGCHCSTG